MTITARLHGFIIAPASQPNPEDPKNLCRDALAEINRLENKMMTIRNAFYEADKDYPPEWAFRGEGK